MELCEFLKFYRSFRCYSQYDLAISLGVSCSTIKRWESGSGVISPKHHSILKQHVRLYVDSLDSQLANYVLSKFMDFEVFYYDTVVKKYITQKGG